MDIKRDNSLDIIKGISCLLMLLAHTPLPFTHNTGLIVNIGGFAPILFFSVSGITATLQAKKTTFRSVALFYIMFAILGLSYNTMLRPNLRDIVSDIPQIIAFSAIIIVFIEQRFMPKAYHYLILAIVIFIVHYTFTKNIPYFPMRQFLFAKGIFPIFPYLSIFLLGIFTYRSSIRLDVFLGLLSLTLFLVLKSLHFNLNESNRFDMSIGFFSLSCTAIFLTFPVFKSLKDYKLLNPLIFLGENSFTFLYLHLFIILTNYGGLGIIHETYSAWIINLLITILLIKLLKSFNSNKLQSRLDHIHPWLLMAFITVLIPLFLPHKPVMVLEFILGIIFATSYASLSRLLKKPLHKRIRKPTVSSVG